MELDRFVKAQDQVYARALKEIRNGHKMSHWIWYIFPQLKGLGHSHNSDYYGIKDLDEAKAYLMHPVLKERLLEITQALLSLKTDNPVEVLGVIDAVKVKSSMTLFHKADPSISLFSDVINKYYYGSYDDLTLHMLKLKIAVFCGSTHGTDPAYRKAAQELGTWIGRHHHTLVYGGGHAGLMGDVSLSVLDHQGKAIAVAPVFLRRAEDPRVSQHIDVKDLSVRKKTMINMADAIVALPGGPGTLEEISDVVSLARLKQMAKPYCFYNINGFYDPLIQFYDEMVEKGFFTLEHREKLHFVTSLEKIVKIIES